MKNFKNNWDGSKTNSIDGTGELVSVGKEEALNILDFIQKNFEYSSPK